MYFDTPLVVSSIVCGSVYFSFHFSVYCLLHHKQKCYVLVARMVSYYNNLFLVSLSAKKVSVGSSFFLPMMESENK